MQGSDHASAVAGLLAELRPADAAERPPGTLRDWGLGSLALTRLWLGIQRELGVTLDPRELADLTEAGLVERIGRAGPAAPPATAPEPEPEAKPGAPFPVTELQRAYLVAKRPDAVGDPVGCHLYREFRLDSPDPTRLRRAWQDLVDRHAMLRAEIREDGTQRVPPRPPRWPMPVHDLPRLTPGRAERDRLAVRDRLSHRRYDAGARPLFAIEVSLLPGGRGIVHLSLDTLLTDAHGFALLLREWHDRYHPPDRPLPPPGPDVAACVRALPGAPAPGTPDEADPARAADLAHWRRELAGLPPGPDLVLDPPRAGTPDGSPDDGADAWCRPRRPLDGALGPQEWNALRDAADRLRVSPTALVLDAFTEALDRAGARRPYCLTVTTSLRPYLPGAADAVVGPFTSTAIHRVDEAAGADPEESVRATGERLSAHPRHGRVSGTEALRALRAEHRDSPAPPTAPPVVFTSLLGVGPAPGVAGGFGAAVEYGVSQTTDVALDHQMWEQDGGLRFRWDVDDSRFTPGTADTAFAFFRNALAAAALPAPVPAPGGPPRPLRQAYLVARASDTPADGCQCYRVYDVPDADPGRLAGAVRRLVDRHPALRTRFGADGALVHPRGPAHWQIPVIDLTGAGDAAYRAVLDRLRAETREHAGHGLTADDLLLTALGRVLARETDGPFALAVVAFPEELRTSAVGEHSFLTWLTVPPAGEPALDTARGYRRRLLADLAEGGDGGLAAMSRRALRAGAAAPVHPVVHTGLVDLDGLPLPDGVREVEWLTATPGCALDCVSVAEGDRLEYAWDIADGVVDQEAAARLFAAFEEELRRCADEAWWTSADAVGEETAARPAATGEERRNVLERWNDTAVPLPDDDPVHALFERQARERPEAVAVRWRGGTLTYGELNRRANRIAHRLRELGVGPGRVVGVRVPRGPAMVAAVHGVLKAGGAYLPVDPALPAARAEAVLRLAGSTLLVATEATAAPAPPASVRVLALESVPGPGASPEAADRDPERLAGRDDLAYVLFTSGSTGTPKGVAVAHRSVRNLLHFCHRVLRPGPGDLGLAVTSLGFDLSVFDLFGLLGAGAAVYVADETQQRDPGLLLDVPVTEPVTVWNSAPTTLHQLVPLLPEEPGSPGTGRLRMVLLSGDVIPVTLPGRVRRAFAAAVTTALGGPTETTVWSNHHRVGEIDPEWRGIPYGRAVDNARHYVLDRALRPCPVGVEGDLYTAGACLAVGFAGRPSLTAHLFVPDPFDAAPGARMYRTGDRALWGADGLLRITGREDGQVKIRGHRVEPGEIEHCLRAHPAVRDAVVLADTAPGGDRVLRAWVTAAPGAAPDPAALRAHAAERLPAYLVPNTVRCVDAFPATANGKLDRAALLRSAAPADRAPAPEPVAAPEPVPAPVTSPP
ncbi:amino acid adenylation domain-containing protein, partial [Streptomyces specialis]|uniref:amino acid adenylation domain-containing protein n=1 Tax=Streptomyces specialis TaxID=498367 RepID=UPI00131C0F5C